jgi:hypothetical protein
MEKQMTKKTAAKTKENPGRHVPNLDSRYGEIGISAVAAAVRYKGETKTSAPAPVSQHSDRWTEAA